MCVFVYFCVFSFKSKGEKFFLASFAAYFVCFWAFAGPFSPSVPSLQGEELRSFGVKWGLRAVLAGLLGLVAPLFRLGGSVV